MSVLENEDYFFMSLFVYTVYFCCIDVPTVVHGSVIGTIYIRV